MFSLQGRNGEFEEEYLVSNITYRATSIWRLQIPALHVHQKGQDKSVFYGTNIYIMNNTVDFEDGKAPTPRSATVNVIGYVQARNVKDFERIAKSTSIPSLANANGTCPSAEQVFQAWVRKVVDRAVAAGCLEEVHVRKERTEEEVEFGGR
jgi:hypothetical protein